MISALLFLIFTGIAYLSGSICSAVIVSALFDLPDPRTQGSKNPGATNVLRLAGKKYAVFVLIADMLKGLVPVLFANLLGAGPIIVGFTCLAAVLGHIYPVFFNFKGGKGVATAMGALLGLNLMLGIVVIALWMLIANFTRYSSLASIITITLTPIIAIIVTQNINTVPPLIFIMLLILYQHRDNMTRLMDGTESKIQLHHHDLSDITDQLVKTNETSSEEATSPKIATTNPKKSSVKTTKTSTKTNKKSGTKTSSKLASKTAKKPVKKAVKKTAATKKV